jgi:hypothetical protein
VRTSRLRKGAPGAEARISRTMGHSGTVMLCSGQRTRAIAEQTNAGRVTGVQRAHCTHTGGCTLSRSRYDCGLNESQSPGMQPTCKSANEYGLTLAGALIRPSHLRST